MIHYDSDRNIHFNTNKTVYYMISRNTYNRTIYDASNDKDKLLKDIQICDQLGYEYSKQYRVISGPLADDYKWFEV